MQRSVLLLAGSTLIFGSASAYFWQQERIGDERSTALEARVKELEGTLAATRLPPPPPMINTVEPPAPPENPPAPSAKAPAPKPAAKVAMGGVGMVREGGPNRLMAGPVFRSMRMDKLLEDPEYRAAMRSQHRMMMSGRYPDLGEALRLQPEEVEKLMDLLADQEIAGMATQPAFGFDGTQPDPAAMQDWSRKMQQRQRDNEAQIAGLLGDSGLQEWKDYQQTLGARMQVKQLRGIMENSSDPIRPDQVRPLVDAMAAEQKRMMEAQMRSVGLVGMAPSRGNAAVIASGSTWAAARPMTPGNQVDMMEKSLEQTAQNNQRMHDAVAPYLSQRQLEQFDKYQNQQLEFQRASLRMMRANAEAEARGETQPNGASISASSALVPMVTTTITTTP